MNPNRRGPGGGGAITQLSPIVQAPAEKSPPRLNATCITVSDRDLRVGRRSNLEGDGTVDSGAVAKLARRVQAPALQNSGRSDGASVIQAE